MKRSYMRFLGVVCVLCGLSLASNASALTYQDGSDIQFTFNSTLSISLSDADIVIGNLIPGQDDTSNAVDVVVNTNNLYGYTLTATVGSATKDYRDLRHTNGTANFASIDVNSDLSTLSGQSSSVWGYTTSTNGTTWSNFNGLPKYDDTANTAELNVTDGAAADSTTSFKIGAFAAEGQLAGDYTNVINFAVVANRGQLYLQDITISDCPLSPTTIVDVRDGEEYTIQKLGNHCWMLDNLRLDLVNVSLDVLKGNTNASDTTLEYLKGLRTGSAGGDIYAKAEVSNWTYDEDGWSSYGRPMISASHANDYVAYGEHTDGHIGGKVGIMYNFCAATAGSYCLPDGDWDDDLEIPDYAVEDVCPKGWHLEYDERSDLYSAYNNNNGELVYAFRGIFSGWLSSVWEEEDGDMHYGIGEEGGVWWSSWYDGAGYVYVYGSEYGYNHNTRIDSLSLWGWSQFGDNGIAVRCVLKSS